MRRCVAWLCLWLPLTAHAQPTELPRARPADFAVIQAQRQAEQKNVAVWLSLLKEEAMAQQVSAEVFKQAFEGFVPIMSIVRLQNRQWEFTITVQQYLARVLNDERIAQARALTQHHSDLLARIESHYGVEASYVVALWGLESQFGERQGSHNVFHALATLAYKGRRRAFFRKELLQALVIAQRSGVSPRIMMGSWAGAMGQVQFMPSSYQNYAQDFNGDGIKDIWNNTDDALASAANYLSQFNWKKGRGWGVKVTMPSQLSFAKAGLETNKARSIKEWRTLGVRPIGTQKKSLRGSQKAWLISPDKNKQEAWLVFPNFKRILFWNRSSYFAISVGTLADSIADG